MTAISGTRSAAPATSRRDAWRTSPVASASGPTMIPGVSTSETTGRPWASQSWRNRAALSAASLVIAPAIWRVSLAMKPSGRPSIRASAVTISGANRSRRKTAEPSSAIVSTIGATARRAARARARGREGAPGRARVPARSPPGRRRAASSSPRSPPPRRRPRRRRRRWPLHRVGPTSSASTIPNPAALDHRRAAHPERDVLGRDDQVGAAGDHRVAGEAAAGDDRDPRHESRELAQSANARMSRAETTG